MLTFTENVFKTKMLTFIVLFQFDNNRSVHQDLTNTK
jgi:hypothetical protein